MPTITHAESIVLSTVSLGQPDTMAGFKSADRPRPITPISPVPTPTQDTHSITRPMPDKNGLRDKANMAQPHEQHAHDNDD